MSLIRRESNTISLASFWENEQLHKYNYNPGYQRDSVWSDEKQAFLIDSILKNIPIPPIFLHQIIDNDTGKTTYDVIDGKQRLTSIIRFIEGEISAASEDEDSPLFDINISGLSFDDLKKSENENIRKQFWRYSIPIEYVDTSNKNIIDAIFDRLNRNGEPLEGQELRRANYYGTNVLDTIEELSKHPFWVKRLKGIDTKRMEDREFISEILFYQLESNYFGSDQKVLDAFYKKYAMETNELYWAKERDDFIIYSKYMSDLNLDYVDFKIVGVSHLYALWCLSIYLFKKDINSKDVKENLINFYTQLRTDPEGNKYTKQYKKSMSSGTKGKSARTKRVEALIEYLNV